MNSTNQATKLKTLPGPWSLGEMTGNWRDIDLPDHGGVMRIVWKMEDDEGRNDALEAQAHAVVAALNAAFSKPPAEQQATSSAVLKAIRAANMQLVRTGDDAFMLVPYKVATTEAETAPQQEAPKAASAIGDELRDTLVAVSAAIAEQDDRTAQKMIREILAASPTTQALSAAPNGWESVIDEARSGLQDSEPSAFDNSGYRAFAETVLDAVEEGLSALAASSTPPAEQQAQPGAVYAELPQPDSWFHFTAQFWENKLYDFADRTHALRMQAAPKAAPAQQEWRLVLPGGKYTDKWESARIGDYNRGWNDYRKTAIAALNSVVWPARTSGSWVGASTWLRNNYQDYPNIASLCDAMLEAAPQQEPVSPISVGWGRDYQDNGKPIDASAAPVPDFAAILQQEAPDSGSCTDGNTPGLMPTDAELLAHIKEAVPGLTRVNTALMVAKAVLEKFGSMSMEPAR